MGKIQTLSYKLEKICLLLLISLPVLAVAVWLYWPIPNPMGMSMRFFPEDVFFDIVNPLDSSIRVMGFTISLIPLAIEALILYYLFKLFQLFEKEQMFTLKNVKYIKNVGICILVGELIRPFYEAIVSLVTHQHNPVGHLMFSISFHNDQIAYILIGSIILLIAKVMKKACILEDERAYTI